MDKVLANQRTKAISFGTARNKLVAGLDVGKQVVEVVIKCKTISADRSGSPSMNVLQVSKIYKNILVGKNYMSIICDSFQETHTNTFVTWSFYRLS